MQPTESELRLILDAIPLLLAELDVEQRHRFHNAAYGRCFGAPHRELQGRSLRETWGGPAYQHILASVETALSGTQTAFEVRLPGAGGKICCFGGSCVPHLDVSGQVSGFLVLLEDITEQRRAEERLRETETRFRAMADGAPVALWMAGTDSLCNFFNQGWLTFTGRSMEQELGVGWAEGIHAEDLQDCMDTYLGAFNRRRAFTTEYRLRRADGEYRWILDNGAPRFLPGGSFAGYIGSCVDITEIKRAHEHLQSSLREKEFLLKEIRHRVKNNLQIILSLLNIQLDSVEDERTLELFRESGNRIYSISLIHDILYQSENHMKLKAGAYFRELADNLFLSYGMSGKQVDLHVEVDDVELDLDAAVPCGLIVSELISNSLKHAFPASRKGELHVDFRLTGPELFLLTVRDNGVGLPKGLELGSSGTLGLQLVRSLTEQVGGTLECRNENGTEFRIAFARERESTS